MPPSKSILRLTLLALLLHSTPRTHAAEFIETLTCQSTQIVHAEITALTPAKYSSDVATIQIHDTLKGPVVRTLLIPKDMGPLHDAEDLLASRTQFLAFITQDKDVSHPEMIAIFCLKNLPAGYKNNDILNLNLDSLTTDTQLTSAIQTQLARPPAQVLRLSDAIASRYWNNPYHATSLPDDPDLLAPHITRWLQSPDPHLRSLACCAMGKIAIPNRQQLLESALHDPATLSPPGDFSPWTRTIYLVRADAASALRQADLKPPPNIEFFIDRSPYTPIPCAWPLLLLPAISLLTYILLRRRKKTVLRALFHALALPSTLVAFALCTLWYRSYNVADDFFYAGYSHILSATSYFGSVKFINASNFFVEQPLCHASHHPQWLGTEHDACYYPYLWNEFGSGNAKEWNYSVNPDDSVNNPRYAGENDDYDLPAQTAVIPFRYFAPYSLLPTLAWTLLMSSTAISRIRRRRRLQKNLCPTCRYDLRASPLRCPECGTPITPTSK